MATATEQVLAGTAAVATVQVRDQHGEAAAPTGTVTVSATSGDGSTVLAAGTETSEGVGVGRRTVTIPVSATGSPDVLTLAWTDAGNGATVRTYVEVVGGFYASVAEVRAAWAPLADEDKYPAEDVRAARALVEAEFERITGRAFVPRYARLRLPVRGGREAVLPHADVAPETVRVWTINPAGELVEVDTPKLGAGSVLAPSGRWPYDIVVSYVHGKAAPPADVLGAFWLRVRDVLNRPNRGVPDRMQTFTSETGGTYSLVVPGQRGAKTGIPDVDVVLADHTIPFVLVA